ncbi:MAG: hypothetical protein Q4A84_03730 [Neisseria sp.]|uniref:DUF4870 family protein n=1 Tax=Neisseria sp. TaxID=192066 RepID=UPI0026DBE7EC|nr:hypothetical protein [Neisseria sp.]MDO4640799.1 hypothetical protein [Neisseria sp.]
MENINQPNHENEPDALPEQNAVHETGGAQTVVEPDNAYNYTLAVYILYALSVFIGVTGLVGVIIAYTKRDDFAGTFYHSHLQYLIKTFWVALIGSIIGTITIFILIGWLILAAAYIWSIYRIVVGFIKFNEKKPVPTEGWF